MEMLYLGDSAIVKGTWGMLPYLPVVSGICVEKRMGRIGDFNE